MQKYNPKSLIWEHYSDYLESDFYNKLYINNKEKEIKDCKYDDAKEGYAQYLIVKYIKNQLLDKKLITNEKIQFTRNGKTWNTWLSIYSEKSYKIFFKIVHLNKTYRIRLIEYTVDKDIDLSQKETSLKENINICNNLLSEGSSYVKFVEVGEAYFKTKKEKPIRESEIVNFDLNNNLSLEENAQEFSKFLSDFLTVKKQGSINASL